jgi:hypothetical protein
MNRHVRWIKMLMGMLALPLSAAPLSLSHYASGTLAYANGSTPSTAYFSASISSRPGEGLTQASPGCSYSNGAWRIQCGSFLTQWQAGDILTVYFQDGYGSNTGIAEVTLTDNSEDPAGRTYIVSSPSQIKLLLPNPSFLRGDAAEIPIQVQNLSPADSVLAFQITVAFDPAVLAATGVTATGTMSANWTSVVAGPRESDMTVAGFTTNQPGSQLVADGGNLVKLKFLVNGLAGSQTTLRLTDAVIYTLSGTVPISNTRSGALHVNSGASTVTKNLSIYPGWNLVSLAVAPDPTNTLPAVMNGVAVNDVWCYIASNPNQPWRSWNLSRYLILPALNDLPPLDGTHGYWINSTQSSSQAWSISGVPVTVGTPIQLYSGWNLISDLPTDSMTIAHAFQSIGSDLSQVWVYRAEDSSNPWRSWDRAKVEAGLSFLNSLQYTKTLLGYWVKVDQAATLVYPNGLSKAIVAAGEPGQPSGVTAVNQTPTTCEFWGWQSELFHQGDTLRAYNSHGVLCGDTLATVEGAFLLHIKGDDPETTDVDEGALEGDTLHFTLNGVLLTVLGVSSGTGVDIISGSAAVFQSMTSHQIKFRIVANGIDQDSKPKSIEFMNYPNPFNSRTLIQYDMKIAGDVDLTIYDASGRAVRRLIRLTKQSAGSHQISWDGADDSGMRTPSGIYFARIQAGRQIRTIKLVVVN